MSRCLFILLLFGRALSQCDEGDEAVCAAPPLSNPLLSASTLTLNDGHEIPIIGLGTWAADRTTRTGKYWPNSNDLFSSDKSREIFEASEEDATAEQIEESDFTRAVISAVNAGYRHIDSAVVYRTEKAIGEALREVYETSDLTRNDLWITTKVPRDYRDIDRVTRGIEDSLRLLQTDYIDLYLIHSPHTDTEKGQRGSDVLEIYRTLIEYQKVGKIKSVGVSNFGIDHLRSIEENGLPLPSVNQIEVSVFLVEDELIEYCQQKGIVIEAYSPLAQAQHIARDDALLKELAAKYGEAVGRELSFAHIMIRWCIDRGFVVLPKSVTPQRIVANGEVFDFEIDAQDMKRLERLKEKEHRICWNPMDTEWDV